MHQKRTEVTKRIPIPRKGTKFVARPLSHLKNSVPIVIAIRNMLKLSKTSKEVKQMIHQKLLKINNKQVKDFHDSIKLFNIFEADKPYLLTLTPTGRFTFNETNDKKRLCKVINKKLLKNNQIQLNLHDGSNIITKDKIQNQDSIYLDFSNKISKHVPLEKGKSCLIISGRYLGKQGTITSIENKKAKVKLEDKEVELERRSIVVI
ncbi:MAG: KOW motif-containing protein [archaeon]